VQKIINFVTRLTSGRWRVVPTQSVDTLQAEIDRLEKHLTYSPVQPKFTKTTTQDLQKYLDLAG
jgi:hypothetical protein